MSRRRALARACVVVTSYLLALHAVSADDQGTGLPAPAELEAQGYVIGRIDIDARNVFNLRDPREDTRLYRMANALHISTREQVIRDQLLLHSGMLYSQRAVDESERILRSARYLYDASIKPVACHDGQVDLLVTTQDVWTLNPGISLGRSGGHNTSGFEIEELNVLGRGSSLSASHTSGIDRSSSAIAFSDRQLGSSWFSLAVAYADNSDGSTKALSIKRPFYSLTTPWALGFSGFDDQLIQSLYDRGTVVDRFEQHSRKATVFAGWSDGLVNGWTRRWTAGFTYDEARFAAAPDWSGATLIPDDRVFAYPWIGFELIQNDFGKVLNRDQIGRTEDVHFGTRLTARVGLAGTSLGSSHDALIADAAVEYGWRASDTASVLLQGTASGRLEGGSVSNGMLTTSARYYWRQSPRYLLFATAEGTIGHDLDVDNQILLGGDNGLRGYPLRYQAGHSRALLTVEQRYFTDWYPFRLFRVGAAAFFDMGRTWGEVEPAGPGDGLLRDIGIGLRIGNTRSGLGNVIHIDMAFPLDGDASIDNVQWLVETRQRF